MLRFFCGTGDRLTKNGITVRLNRLLILFFLNHNPFTAGLFLMFPHFSPFCT